MEKKYKNPQDYFLNNQFTSVLVGKISDNDAIIFKSKNGELVGLGHSQDCCECVALEDVVGDLTDLVDAPILVAEERTNSENNNGDSETWTFYTFRTIKGSVDLRFNGSSNGYYSESVDFFWNDGIGGSWDDYRTPLETSEWPNSKMSKVEVLKEKIKRLQAELARIKDTSQ